MFTGNRSGRAGYLFLAGIVIWACCASFLKRPFVGDEVDDGQYLVGARSLRDGAGYRLPSRVGAPVATKYPPGVSAVTAVGLKLMPGPTSLAKEQAVAKAFMCLSAIGLAVATRRLCALCGLDRWTAVLLALAMLMHPAVVTYSHILTADLPFAFLATWLACRWASRWQHPGSAPARSAALDGLLVAAAMLTRSNGVTLLAAGLVAWMASSAAPRGARVRAAAVHLVVVALLVGGATALVARQAGDRDTGGYRAELAAAYSSTRQPWHIPAGNLSRMPGVAAFAAWPMAQWPTPAFGLPTGVGPVVRVLLLVVTPLTMAVGLWTIGLGKLGPAVLTQCGATVAVFCAWYYPFNIRFALPLVPIGMIAFVVGLGRLAQRRVTPVPAWRFGAGIVLGGGLLVLVAVMVRAAHHGGVEGAGTDPEQAAALAALRRLTPADAVIVCPTPELVYLNTDRQAAPLVDDARAVARLPPTWDTLGRWLRPAGGRPIYFYGERPVRAPRPNDTEAVVESSPFVIRTVYASESGNQWVGQLVEDRRPATTTSSVPMSP